MLDDMDNETRNGTRLLTSAALNHRDRGALDLIDEFVRGQRANLTTLGDSERVLRSLSLLDRIALRSAGLRTNLNCGTGAGPSDDLGAVTPTCPAGTTRSGGSGSGGPARRTETAPTGKPAGGNPATPAPSPSKSGLLDDLGRLVGGH